ncbi:XrtA/PEP-CTERM system exopolysaccharide export protein [Neoroseomonas lacus]|uniref:Sugar ABC transporter substrate-binding protein n=1 Tax=Neoroseomonas lacus TaxID=287609 RepID=A0A917NFZ7_9PROT|nr:XrtA/PEP-CTERM system exopolysaccharide export protein [Neoroseomonas lacus]GGI97443.1 sugar ABC transporter substrate-binding protein [Neoroseomonas lacus]
MKLRGTLHCMAMLLILAVTACAAAPTQLPEAAPPTGSSAPAYVIGPGDTLDVFVYLAPELSASALPVRPDGRISLPLVPDVVAAGRTPSELASEVAGQLRRYVIEPNVTILVRGFVGAPSQQIRVIGEAAQPRAMPYREGITVLDVIIEARGLTRYAAGNRAEIIRRDAPGGPVTKVPVRLDDLLRGGDISQDVRMRPGDTLVIPQGWF